jgi:hypothetical protein
MRGVKASDNFELQFLKFSISENVKLIFFIQYGQALNRNEIGFHNFKRCKMCFMVVTMLSEAKQFNLSSFMYLAKVRQWKYASKKCYPTISHTLCISALGSIPLFHWERICLEHIYMNHCTSQFNHLQIEQMTI